LHALGERIHPGTGARIAYVACGLAAGTARPGSSREVAEIRWVTPLEADELTRGAIFEPVRQYLHATIEADG
jgi:8-oxo-dGTP diphosphatase